MTVSDEPGPGFAAQVAGVEAAIWAETIADFDNLSFLLPPRLSGIAQRLGARLRPLGYNRPRWPAPDVRTSIVPSNRLAGLDELITPWT